MAWTTLLQDFRVAKREVWVIGCFLSTPTLSPALWDLQRGDRILGEGGRSWGLSLNPKRGSIPQSLALGSSSSHTALTKSIQ